MDFKRKNVFITAPVVPHKVPVTSFIQFNNELELTEKFGKSDMDGAFRFQTDDFQMVTLKPQPTAWVVIGDSESVNKFKSNLVNAGIGFWDLFTSFLR